MVLSGIEIPAMMVVPAALIGREDGRAQSEL
jgi:hypothetical protein